jgi:hypothetical protein
MKSKRGLHILCALMLMILAVTPGQAGVISSTFTTSSDNWIIADLNTMNANAPSVVGVIFQNHSPT